MKSINNNAPVRCAKTITIKCSSEKVWKVLTDINNWANWQTDICNPRLNGELTPNTTFEWKQEEQKLSLPFTLLNPLEILAGQVKLLVYLLYTIDIDRRQQSNYGCSSRKYEWFLCRNFKKTLQSKIRERNAKMARLVKTGV